MNGGSFFVLSCSSLLLFWGPWGILTASFDMIQIRGLMVLHDTAKRVVRGRCEHCIALDIPSRSWRKALQVILARLPCNNDCRSVVLFALVWSLAMPSYAMLDTILPFLYFFFEISPTTAELSSCPGSQVVFRGFRVMTALCTVYEAVFTLSSQKCIRLLASTSVGINPSMRMSIEY